MAFYLEVEESSLTSLWQGSFKKWKKSVHTIRLFLHFC